MATENSQPTFAAPDLPNSSSFGSSVSSSEAQLQVEPSKCAGFQQDITLKPKAMFILGAPMLLSLPLQKDEGADI